MNEESLILLTDLYELTMMAAYYHSGMQEMPAVFEYIFRKLTHNFGYCIFAGLDTLLDDLETLHFSESDIDYLRSLKIFDEEFLPSIRDFKFEGDVFAAPEGSLVFPYETILRVQAPIIQSQLIETLLLNRLNYQSLIATKASRCVIASQGDPIIEFGLRRAQGPDGGISGARAAFVGGAVSTSDVMAGKLFDIPVMGTHAHSWVMAFDSELESFRAYVKAFPKKPVLLIDTYDTLQSGLPNAIATFKELRKTCPDVRAGIRLDSGDIAGLSKEAHRQLEAAGFHDPLIVASGDLDEDMIAEIKRNGGKANSWGVGTKLITGGSEPALPGIYKLTAVEKDGEWINKMKISDTPAKMTDPGIKMPYRFYSGNGLMQGDVMFLDGSEPEGLVESYDRVISDHRRFLETSEMTRLLLEPVMIKGKRLFPKRRLQDIQAYAKSELEKLPEESKRLSEPETYWVGLSQDLAEKKDDIIRAFWEANYRPEEGIQ